MVNSGIKKAAPHPVPPTGQQDSDQTNAESSLSGYRHLSPMGQPDSVHEISDALYRPFQTQVAEDAGIHFRISGCQIDMVPFVQAEDGRYYLLNGTQVSEQHATSLGLDDLQQREAPPHECTTSVQRQSIADELERLAEQVRLADAADGRQWLVWCSHVHGVLVAEKDSESISVPFSMWGSRLNKGLDKCPPFHCPIGDVDTYNLACDDDGTITDADSIVTCPESGRRLQKAKLETCQATGKLMDPEGLSRCPVNNHLVSQSVLKKCNGCFQQVAPNALLQKGRCFSCRNLSRLISNANTDSQRRWHEAWLQLQQKFPALAIGSKVRFAEQAKEWLVHAKIGRNSWILVVDRETLDILRAAKSGGWLKPWSEVKNLAQWPV